MSRFLILLLCTLPVLTKAQSPWPQTKGRFYTQVSWQGIPEYDAVFTKGKISYTPLERRISEQTLQLYGEYGISYHTTVWCSVPWRIMRSGEPVLTSQPATAAGKVSGLGNASLAVRQSYFKWGLCFGGQLRVDLPAGGYDDATGLRTGYDAFTILPMLSAGKGYAHGYWFVYGGYGLRTNRFDHFMNFGAEAGYKIWKIYLIGFSERLSPLDNGEVALPQNNLMTSLYVNGQGWWSVGAKGILEINERTGVVLTAAGAFSGSWVPKRPGLGLGVYFKSK